MNLTQSFKNQAQVILDDLSATFPFQDLEANFRQNKFVAVELSSEKFRALLLAFLTAQVSLKWSQACRDHGIDLKEIQNLFFKTVLDRYSEAKDLEGASYFSEAMYAANSQPDQLSLTSILTAFFKKLGVSSKTPVSESAENFRWMASVWEGYCHHFENEFEDFVVQLRLRGVVSQEKRG